MVHTVEATAANVHDVTEISKLLTGDEDEVYGDNGYLGAGKREDAVVENKSGRKIQYKINLRPSQIKKLSKEEQAAVKEAEHAKSSVRAKVEHVFGVVKKQLRFRKTGGFETHYSISSHGSSPISSQVRPYGAPPEV